MPSKSTSTASRHPGRTFSGCLTCRRRKVKCDSQLSPCGNCKRIKLSCKASFWTNFIDASPAQSRSRLHVLSPPPGGHAAPLTETQSPQPAPEEPPSHMASSTATAARRQVKGATAQDQVRDDDVEVITSPDMICDSMQLANENTLANIGNAFPFNLDWTQPDLETAGPFENLLLPTASTTGFIPKEWQLDHVWAAMASEYLAPPGASGAWPSRGPCDSYDRLITPAGALEGQLPIISTEQIQPFHSSTNAFSGFPSFPELSPSNMDSFLLPRQMPSVPTSAEPPLIRHYEMYMSKFLSVKDPQWNLYTYMLRSPQGCSESPLRHSLLAWSGFHVSSLKKDLPEDGAKYYHAASSAVEDLLMEFSHSSGSVISSERLRMLLSATFFLCYCDIMACHPDRFYTRLQGLQAALSRNWDSISSAISPITSRLLVWISYLEIRASLWGVYGASSSPHGPQKLLLDILSDRASLPSFYTRSGSYLGECFGEQYPTSELNQDLQQEAGNLKLLEIMTILSQVVMFENWERNLDSEDVHSATMQELRMTRIRLLKAEIARIRAECQQAVPISSTRDMDRIDRTSFHWLTVTALHLSATILLSRILYPNIRTEPESQAAASELLRIARRLRKTRYLQTPRSFIWPLPIFIAGIETTDELYQDWVVEYLREMSGWGRNMGWVRRVLKGVVERQAREERRVRVRHVMEDLGLVMIV